MRCGNATVDGTLGHVSGKHPADAQHKCEL